MRDSYDYYHFPRDTNRADFKAWYQNIRKSGRAWDQASELGATYFDWKAANIWKRAFTPVDVYIWEDLDRFMRFDDIAQSLYL